MMKAILSHLTKMVLVLNCANISNGSGTRELMCVGGRRDQWLSVFLAKETLLPGCVGIAPHLEAGGTRLQAPPLTGPIVFALIAKMWPCSLPSVTLVFYER